MFRFEKDLRRVAKGDLTVRINLRQKDQFSEVAKSFNEMTSGINEKLQKIDREIDMILNENPENKTVQEYEIKISELKQKVHQNFSL